MPPTRNLLLILLFFAAPALARPKGEAAPSLPVADSLGWRLERQRVFGERGSATGQLLEPRGLAVDAFGRFFLADAAMHRLERFDARGTWLGESGGLGGGAGQMRRPVAACLLGTLSVAVLDQENQRIVAYDLNGNLAGTVVDLTNAETVPVERARCELMASDGGGALYLGDPANDRLLVFDFAGRFLRSLGSFGSAPGQLRRLAGVAVSPQGQLLLTERLNARLQRWDPSGKPAAAWSLPVKTGSGALPLAADDSGRVAVADEAAGRLFWFDANGTLLAWADGLGRPAAVVSLGPGKLAVAEAATGRVSLWTARRRE